MRNNNDSLLFRNDQKDKERKTITAVRFKMTNGNVMRIAH